MINCLDECYQIQITSGCRSQFNSRQRRFVTWCKDSNGYKLYFNAASIIGKSSTQGGA